MDDVQLIQSAFSRAERESCQKFLQGGVACPQGHKDQIALFVTNAGIDV
jgi:hypothetical protein